MSNIIRNTINKIDSLYHQKNIFSVLKGLNLQTAIDVGAHKGEFLSYLLKLNSIKNIHAFEPQKKIFNELEQKFLSNDLIILNNFAISDESGFKNIKINKLTSTSTFSEISANSIWAKLKSCRSYYFYLSGRKENSRCSRSKHPYRRRRRRSIWTGNSRVCLELAKNNH